MIAFKLNIVVAGALAAVSSINQAAAQSVGTPAISAISRVGTQCLSDSRIKLSPLVIVAPQAKVPLLVGRGFVPASCDALLAGKSAEHKIRCESGNKKRAALRVRLVGASRISLEDICSLGLEIYGR